MNRKILYLCHRIPYPPNKGDKIRSFNEVRFLSQTCTIDLDSRADQGTDEFLQVYHPTNNADEKSSGVACIQKGGQLCHQRATQLH